MSGLGRDKMRLRHVLMCFAACAVTGCNAVLPSGDDVDPLADVERLSDVDVADDAQSVSIAATESGGFFAGLLGGNRETPDSETTPETASAPQRGGLFGFLGGGTSDATTPDAAATIDPDQVAPLTMQAFGEVGKTCGCNCSFYRLKNIHFCRGNPSTFLEAMGCFIEGF